MKTIYKFYFYQKYIEFDGAINFGIKPFAPLSIIIKIKSEEFNKNSESKLINNNDLNTNFKLEVIRNGKLYCK